jgi:hypothetical protein
LPWQLPAARLSTDEGQHFDSAGLIPPAVQSMSALHKRVLMVSRVCFGTQSPGDFVQ